MPKILLGSQTFQGQSGGVTGQRLLNFYAKKNPEGSKYPFTLRATPGLKLWLDLGENTPIQGMQAMGDYLYAISNNKGFKIDIDANKTTLSGTISGTQGMLDLANNGTQLGVVTPDGDGYYLTSTNVTHITDGQFPAVSSIAFLDGYSAFSKKDSAQFIIPENLYDITAYDAADFATAEKGPGNLVRTTAFNGELWQFKKTSYEVWENTGNADFPFELIKSSVDTTRGLGAKFSVAQDDNSLFFIGSDRIVYRAANGYTPSIISTDEVSEVFENFSSISDAFGFIYTENGHKFYIITFPSARATWGYDIATGLWHERDSLGLGRWRANCFANFAGKNLVGDYQTGKIYELSLTTYDDAGSAMESIVEGSVIWDDEKRISHDVIRLDMKSGVGLTSGQGSDPQVMMQYSDNGGRSWSNERWRSFGKKGEYKTRPMWRRNGKPRERIYRFKITDPVERIINGAYIGARASLS